MNTLAAKLFKNLSYILRRLLKIDIDRAIAVYTCDWFKRDFQQRIDCKGKKVIKQRIALNKNRIKFITGIP